MLEVETAGELQEMLSSRGNLRDVIVEGVDLAGIEIDWGACDFTRAVFIACPMADATAHELLAGGAVVIPDLRDNRPYSVYPSTLYGYEDLVAGGADARIERWFRGSLERPGDANPTGPVEAIAQRLHDTAMTDGIYELIRPAEGEGRRVVGIMGGHSLRRDTADYAAIVLLAYRLTEAGYFIATGGGPGVMEAGNLGAYLTRAGDEGALAEAIATLATSPSVEHPGYDDAAERVHSWWAGREGGESLGIPTWVYGHEPVARFPTHIAKYFANSIREDGLLQIADCGIVFARGGPGTIQEVFQDAAINAYAPPEQRAPMVFLGSEFFSANGVFDVVRSQAAGASPPYDELLSLTDDVEEAVDFIGSR